MTAGLSEVSSAGGGGGGDGEATGGEEAAKKMYALVKEVERGLETRINGTCHPLAPGTSLASTR
jgi:hypothetical protein